MDKPIIFFISETAPVNAHASAVIFYRHFRMLENEGYQIMWVTDQNSYNESKDTFPPEWSVMLLPNRKWHLPPYRTSGILQTYRFAYYYKLIKKKISSAPENSILITYLNGQFLPPFAAYIKLKTCLPLLTFFHDDILELNYHRNPASVIENTNRVLEASSRILVVSDEFRTNWGKYEHKFKLLYPVPEQCQPPLKKASVGRSITFGYSGAIYDEIVPYLGLLASAFKKLGHRLVIIGDRSKVAHLQEQYKETVLCLDMFRTPGEAHDYLMANTNAALIPYPEELSEMPWIRTCFPSKFLQYCQMGLPALILAPGDSAIGKWCAANQWPLYYNTYDVANLADLPGKINDRNLLGLIDALRKADFDPAKIHEHFFKIITDVLLKH